VSRTTAIDRPGTRNRTGPDRTGLAADLEALQLPHTVGTEPPSQADDPLGGQRPPRDQYPGGVRDGGRAEAALPGGSAGSVRSGGGWV